MRNYAKMERKLRMIESKLNTLTEDVLTEKRMNLIEPDEDDENDVSDASEFIKCYLNPIYNAVKGKTDGLDQIEAIRKVLKRKPKCSLDVTSYEDEEDNRPDSYNRIVIYTYEGDDSSRIFIKEIEPICDKIQEELDAIELEVRPGLHNGGKVTFKWKNDDFGSKSVDSLYNELEDAFESVADVGSYEPKIVKRSAKCFENYEIVPFVQSYTDFQFVDGKRHRTNYDPDEVYTYGPEEGFGYFIVGNYSKRDKDALRSKFRNISSSLEHLLMGSHGNGLIRVFKRDFKIDGKDCIIVMAENGG